MRLMIVLMLASGALGCAPVTASALSGRIALGDRDPSGVDQIFFVKTDGGERQQLTRGVASAWMPAWSPDGSRLAYVTRTSDGMQIWVARADGSEARRLTDDRPGLISMSPSWSPDGREIAYASNARGGPLRIWIMTADGTNARELTRGDDNVPTWSPDGRMLAYTSNARGHFEIWVMRPEGGDARPLTTAYYEGGLAAWIEQKVPTWSPDGTRIAYWAGVEATDARPDLPRDVWVIRSDGRDARRLVAGDDPAWSPDGAWILFPTCADARDRPSSLQGCGARPGDGVAVAAVGPDGRDARVLFRTNGSFGRLSWQPAR